MDETPRSLPSGRFRDRRGLEPAEGVRQDGRGQSTPPVSTSRAGRPRVSGFCHRGRKGVDSGRRETSHPLSCFQDSEGDGEPKSFARPRWGWHRGKRRAAPQAETRLASGDRTRGDSVPPAPTAASSRAPTLPMPPSTLRPTGARSPPWSPRPNSGVNQSVPHRSCPRDPAPHSCPHPLPPHTACHSCRDRVGGVSGGFPPQAAAASAGCALPPTWHWPRRRGTEGHVMQRLRGARRGSRL